VIRLTQIMDCDQKLHLVQQGKVILRYPKQVDVLVLATRRSPLLGNTKDSRTEFAQLNSWVIDPRFARQVVRFAQKRYP